MSQEGEKHLKAAAKALKTNPWSLKFKPDYETAAQEYSEAARCFQGARDHKRAVQALRDFAQTRQIEGDMFGAGRGFENVAASCQNSLNDWEGSCTALSQAAECYVLAGKVDSGCRVWLKVADICESKLNNYPEASSAFRKCVELNQIEEKDHNTADVLKNYVGFLARSMSKNEKFEEELKSVLDQQMELQVRLGQVASFHKTVLCKVVLWLHRGNSSAASEDLDRAATMCPALIGSKELDLAQKLLTTEDANDFKQLISSSTITYLPVEFAKLARHLECPKSPRRFQKTSSKAPMQDSSDEEVPTSGAPEDVAEFLM